MLVVAAMAASSELKAQDNFGVWGEVGVEHEVNKRLDISSSIEIRRRDNISEPDRLSLDLGGSYKINNWLKAGAVISLLEDNRHKLNTSGRKVADYWSGRFRVSLGLTFSHSWNKLSVSLRERWQYTLRPRYTTLRYWTYTDEDDDRYEGEVADIHTYGVKAKNVWRNRLQLKYKVSKTWRPYASVETNVSHGLEKIRYAGGTEIRLNKHHWLDAKYIYQSTPNDDDDEGNRHILSIGYTYKF